MNFLIPTHGDQLKFRQMRIPFDGKPNNALSMYMLICKGAKKSKCFLAAYITWVTKNEARKKINLVPKAMRNKTISEIMFCFSYHMCSLSLILNRWLSLPSNPPLFFSFFFFPSRDYLAISGLFRCLSTRRLHKLKEQAAIGSIY